MFTTIAKFFALIGNLITGGSSCASIQIAGVGTTIMGLGIGLMIFTLTVSVPTTFFFGLFSGKPEVIKKTPYAFIGTLVLGLGTLILCFAMGVFVFTGSKC